MPDPKQLRDALPREEAGGSRAACGVEDMSEVLVVAAVQGKLCSAAQHRAGPAVRPCGFSSDAGTSHGAVEKPKAEPRTLRYIFSCVPPRPAAAD
jgi:hypothetical protein